MVGVQMLSMGWIFSSLLVSRRQSSEPPVENGLIPYLGCALQFGANPLQFLRSRQKKYGHIFTCKIAGQYIHFLCDPFSYHSVIRQGRHLDWMKFHFATSVKVFVGFHLLSNGIILLWLYGEGVVSRIFSLVINQFFSQTGIWPRQLRPSSRPHHREPTPNLYEDPAG